MKQGAGRDWVHIPERQARLHPLYGLNFILFGCYVLTLGGLLVRAGTLSTAMALSPLFDPQDVRISGVLLACGLGLPLPLLMLSLVWHRVMPAAAIACIWAGVALDAGFLLLGMMTPVVLPGTIASTAAAPLLTFYVLLSRRVNVTYRHRVRSNDPILAAPRPV